MIAGDRHGGGTGTDAAPDGGRARDLAVRATSALVLAPIALASAVVGGWLFLAFCIVAAGGILWEWAHLVAARAEPRILVPGWAVLVAATALVGVDAPGAAALAIAAGVALAGAACGWPRAAATLPGWTWAAGGVAYAGIAFLGPALLRRDPEWGLPALLFLFATVWATDIFAFLVGAAAGGPPLWPRISPHKTWAGAVGGLAGGVAAGIAVAYASGVDKLGIIGAMALLLSIATQAGDLFESAVKRRFGAKDTGALIPGHGGLMDRLDGFLVAAVIALGIGVLRQGMDAPGRGLLLW